MVHSSYSTENCAWACCAPIIASTIEANGWYSTPPDVRFERDAPFLGAPECDGILVSLEQIGIAFNQRVER